MRPVRAFRSVAVVAAACVCAVVAGCGGSPTAPSSAALYSQTDLLVGTGTTAASGSIVTVNYTGWFFDATKPNQKGLQFDTSVGGTPFIFTLGFGYVIPGWDQGVVGMKVGGLRRLVIPPSLAYGTNRNGSIPPSATLIFEIELLGINEAPAVTTQPASQTVTAGQTVTFTAAASGTPTPSAQWQVSTDGSTWTALTDAAPYSGALTTTLTVTGVTSALNGAQYRVLFTNTMGTATTDAATLTVH